MQNGPKNSNPAIQFAATHVGPPEHPILRLQRTAGNQAVLHWLRPGGGAEGGVADEADAEAEPDAEPAPKPIWPRVIPVIMIVTFLAYFCYRFAVR